jgi:two-component system LytT family response regulator
MITVIIADDEKHARERLKELLSVYPEFKVTAEAEDGEQLAAAIIARQGAVAFLDINMPGISVFQSITALKNLPLIVFQTAYAEHAVEAFNVNALDYLLKPISRDRFAACIKKIRQALLSQGPGGQDQTESPDVQPEPEQELESKPPSVSRPVYDRAVKRLSVRSGQMIKVIEINAVVKISFEAGFSFIYTADSRYYSDKFLHFFEELLSVEGFYRINRNEIVNLNLVKKIHPMLYGTCTLELENGEKLDVSRRRVPGLKERLNLL